MVALIKFAGDVFPSDDDMTGTVCIIVDCILRRTVQAYLIRIKLLYVYESLIAGTVDFYGNSRSIG